MTIARRAALSMLGATLALAGCTTPAPDTEARPGRKSPASPSC